MRFLSRIGVTSILLSTALFVVPSVSANHVEDVLGDSTDLSEIEFPGLAAGPGFILPDSRLYPVDKLVQEVRLMLAFTPEQEARVHENIAGERMAEAKVMIERNDSEGIATALSGFEREVALTSESIGDAAAKGRDVKELARSTNDAFGEYRRVLDTVAMQAPAALSLRLLAANQHVLEAKARVEDQLPPDELAIAIETDLQDEVDSQVLGVQDSVNKLENKSTTLENRQGMKFEEASRSANAEQKKKLMQEISARRQALLDDRKKLMEQIKALMQQLQENQKALKKMNQGQSSGFLPSVTPTVTPTQ